jgi:hypothetical protein
MNLQRNFPKKEYCRNKTLEHLRTMDKLSRGERTSIGRCPPLCKHIQEPWEHPPQTLMWTRTIRTNENRIKSIMK